jgi:predicted nucleic-acid-binding Zn-ribbon protein
MKLVLSCLKCGSTNFRKEQLNNTNIENISYLLHEDVKGAEVTCIFCGLRDYVQNLVITFRSWSCHFFVTIS